MNVLAPRTVSPVHEWKAIPLGELLLELRNGLVAVQEKELPGIPITRIETISHGVVNLDRVRYVRDVPSEKLKRFWLKKGDLLFSHINSDLHLGKTAVVISEVPLLHGMNLLLLRPDPNRLASKFLHYWLDHCRRVGRFMAIAQHAVNQSSLNQQKISSLEIPLPPVGVQDEIVAEIEKQFSRLDEAVANLKRVKANLKRYKAAVLKAAVEGRLVPTEAELARKEIRTYETGGELLRRVIDIRRKGWNGKSKFKEPTAPDNPKLSDLPSGWAWANVDQLARVGTGATPNRGRTDYFDNGTVPWVTSAVVNERYVDEASEFVTTKALAETNLTLYPIGTLVVAMYGEGKTRGKCAELRISATTNQALAALQVDSQVCCYLRMFLEHNYEETRKVASGGVQPNLNLSLVRSIVVPLPPLVEQKRIVDEVERHLSLVRGVEAQVDANLKRAERMRQAVLQTAFAAGPVARQ